MSVYTAVSEPELAGFLEAFDVGDLTGFQGIRAGVVNTNYFVTTTGGEYVLTLFETLSAAELPYFLELMAYLSDHGVPSAHPVAGRDGRFLRELNERPAALVHRIAGADLERPTPTQCAVMGCHLARLHVIGRGFSRRRPNPLGPSWWRATASQLEGRIPEREWELLVTEADYQVRQRPANLPAGVVHADLFRDNALFIGDNLNGIIDFYYACDEALVFDLAVTVNDWCGAGEVEIDPRRARAMLAAYHAERTITADERVCWSDMLRGAAMRFWVSRLVDKCFPRDGHLTHIKDPDHFRDLLEHRIAHAHELDRVWQEL